MPKNEIPTAKTYRPNWKNIFSQLGNYFFTVKHNLLANKYTEAFLPLFSGFYCCLFLIVLRDNETSCQTKSARQRLASPIKANSGHLLRPNSVVYYDQRQPSIKTKPGRLLRPIQAANEVRLNLQQLPKMTGAKTTGQHYQKAKMTDKRKMT